MTKGTLAVDSKGVIYYTTTKGDVLDPAVNAGIFVPDLTLGGQ
jgi:hypothetical protein